MQGILGALKYYKGKDINYNDFVMTYQSQQVTSYLSNLNELPELPTQDPQFKGYNDQGYEYHQMKKLMSLECMNPQDTNVWPGAIIQGKDYYEKGEINGFALPRSPGRVTVSNVLGAKAGSVYRELKDIRLGEVSNAINDVIRGLDPNGSGGGAQGELRVAYSMQQAMLDLGLNFNGFGAEVEGSFSYSHETSTSSVLVDVAQIFYTVKFEPDHNSFFDHSVTTHALETYTALENPPLYFSDVHYGMRRIILAQAASSSTELQAALRASFTRAGISGGVNFESKHQRVLEKTSLQVYTIGGNSGFQSGLSGTNLPSYLKGENFTKDTPAAVVSAQPRYLDDQTVAKIFLATSWTKPGQIKEMQVGEGAGHFDKLTGIKAQRNLPIVINASGRVWGGVAATGTNGPDGWVGWEAGHDFPLPKRPPFCLIGKWGGGPWFEIGQYKKLMPGANDQGELKLSINDNVPENGGGTWTVSIEHP